MDLTEPQLLLLRAAMAPVPDALHCFGRWRERVALNDVAGTDFRLLPLIYQNIGRHLPNDVLKARLRGIAQHAWLRNRSRLQLCGSLLERLSQRDMPFLLIKGAAVMLVLGAAAELRFLADCDVLVPLERALEAVDLLRDLGLICPYLAAEATCRSDLHLIHGLGFAQPNSPVGLIDLHWRPLADVESPGLTQAFFEASTAAVLDGRKVRVPAADHVLLQAIVHGTQWAEQARYDWMVDGYLLMRMAGEGLDWRRLWMTAERFGLAGLLEDSLDILADSIVPPIPSRIWRRRTGRMSSLERRDCIARSKHPAERSPTDWLILDLQKIHRADEALGGRPPEACLPVLLERQRAPRLPPPAQPEAAGGPPSDDPILYVSGWSHPEKQGRWTDGRLATIAIRLPPELPSPHLVMTSLATAPPSHPVPTAGIFAANRLVTRVFWPAGTASLATHVIDLSSLEAIDGYVILQFRFAYPHIPARLALGADIRRLGMLVTSMRCQTVDRGAAESHAGSPQDATAPDQTRITFVSGWSAPEQHGRWTNGDVATLRVSLAGGSSRLVLRSRAVTSSESPRQYADVYADNQYIARLRWPQGHHVSHCHELDLSGVTSADRAMTMDFHIAHPRLPLGSETGTDRRRLGLLLESVLARATFRSITEGRIDLSATSPDRALLLTGWDMSPDRGCWTTRASASLRWDGTVPAGARLTISVLRCFAPGTLDLSGRVTINDCPAGTFRLTGSTPMPVLISLDMPEPGETAAHSTTLRFDFDTIRSPASLGLSGDVRELGLLIGSIELA
jgi:hypothetical protein